MLKGWQKWVSCCLCEVEHSSNIECVHSWSVRVVQPEGDAESAKGRRGFFGSDFPSQKVLGIWKAFRGQKFLWGNDLFIDDIQTI